MKRMEGLLKHLYNKGRLESKKGGKVKQQFRSFIELVSTDMTMRDKFCKFSLKSLDTLYANCLKSRDGFEELWFVVKMILILSHGNTVVESGFSINKQMLVENLHEESLVVLCQVYDSVKAIGGVKKMTVTKDMLTSVRQSYQKYEEAHKKKADEARNVAHNVQVARKRKVSELQMLLEKNKRSI